MGWTAPERPIPRRHRARWSYPVSVDSLGLSSPALRWATAGGRKVFSPAPFWGMEVKRHNAPLSALCTPCKVCILPPIKRSPKIRTAYSVPLPADHQVPEELIISLLALASRRPQRGPCKAPGCKGLRRTCLRRPDLPAEPGIFVPALLSAGAPEYFVHRLRCRRVFSPGASRLEHPQTGKETHAFCIPN